MCERVVSSTVGYHLHILTPYTPVRFIALGLVSEGCVRHVVGRASSVRAYCEFYCRVSHIRILTPYTPVLAIAVGHISEGGMGLVVGRV